MVEGVGVAVAGHGALVGARGGVAVAAVIAPFVMEGIAMDGDLLVVAAVRVAVVRATAVTAVLGVAVDVLGAQAVGVDAVLGQALFHLVGAVGLLQPVLGVAAVGGVGPVGGVGHHVVAVTTLHVVPDQLVTLGDVVAVAAGPVTEVLVAGVIDLVLEGGPPLAHVLAQHHVFDAVVRAGVSGAAHVDAAAGAVDVEHQGVADELVVHGQHGAAVGLDDHAGGGVGLGVLLIAVQGGGDVGRVGGDHRGVHRAGGAGGVLIHVGGGAGGVVVDLLHVHDGVAHVAGGPLGVQGGVALDGDGGAGRLGQFLVQVPAVEGVAGLGGGGGGHGDGFAVQVGAAGHVAAAVGLIGQGEALAGVGDHQFLALGLGDGGAFRQLQGVVVEGLGGGGHVAVQDAVDMLAGVRDLGVAVAGQVLHLVHEVVLSGVGHILDADGGLLLGVEVIFRQGDGGRGGIVDGGAGDLVGVGLGGGRRGQGVGELVGLDLHEVGVEQDLGAAVVLVEVLGGDGVDQDLTELGHGGDGAGDHGVGGDFLTGLGVDPLLEHAAGHEGILGHGGDGLALGHLEVLGEALDLGGAVLLVDHEADFVFVLEGGHDGHVGGHGLAADDLGLIHEPAGELLAFHHGVRGEGQGVAGVVAVGLVDLLAHHVGDGEDVLVVMGPDGQLPVGVGHGVHMHRVVEVTAAVHPLADGAGLGGDAGDVVQAVGGVHVDGAGGHGGAAQGLVGVELHGVGGVLVVGHDDRVTGGDVGGVDAGAVLHDLTALGAIDEVAQGPVCIIVSAGDGSGIQAAQGLAGLNLDGGVFLEVAVIEGHGVQLGVLGRGGDVSGGDGVRVDLGGAVEPAVEAVAVLGGAGGQLAADGLALFHLDGGHGFAVSLEGHREGGGRIADGGVVAVTVTVTLAQDRSGGVGVGAFAFAVTFALAFVIGGVSGADNGVVATLGVIAVGGTLGAGNRVIARGVVTLGVGRRRGIVTLGVGGGSGVIARSAFVGGISGGCLHIGSLVTGGQIADLQGLILRVGLGDADRPKAGQRTHGHHQCHRQEDAQHLAREGSPRVDSLVDLHTLPYLLNAKVPTRGRARSNPSE